MFKFRILDLFLITAWAAAVAGVHQTEFVFFRQLLCGSLVAVFATSAVLLVPNVQRPRLAGAIGGSLGALMFVAILYALPAWLYGREKLYHSPVSMEANLFAESVVAFLVSLPLGATLGPLLSIHFQKREFPDELIKPFWWSIILMAGTVLLGFFAMFDRMSFQDRDWNVLLLILSVFFLIHTNSWLGRLGAADDSVNPDAMVE